MASCAYAYVEELEGPSMDMKVSVEKISPVVPSATTPTHSLYLSNLDDMVGSRFLTPSVYFYTKSESCKNMNSAGKAITEALSRVLVPYYPFAGRLRDAGRGKLEVVCTGEGALFVEAHTDMALADLSLNLGIPNASWKPLIYFFPEEPEHNKILYMPLVVAQITYFSCGGFSLGLRICHCLCDGIGAMQFVNAWAEMARGAATLSVNPCWERESLKPRSPPLIQFSHVEFEKIHDKSNLIKTIESGGHEFIQKCFCLKRQYQMALKDQIYREAQLRCTTFDVLAAHVWRCWIKALNVSPGEQEMRLTFAANARSKFRPPLKDGFYGNLIGIACAMGTAEDVRKKALSETVRLVQAARKSITEEYIRSTIDYLEAERPTRLEFEAKLGITQWTRFSLYETDFGWGSPVYAGPIDLSPTPQVCVFLPHLQDSDSIVVCMCLPASSVSAFKRCLLQDDDDLEEQRSSSSSSFGD
eukprot:Gb_33885 [translate_table: standard]